MTTPKEALEQAVSFARQVACIEGVRRAPEMKAIAEQYQAIFEQALASLEGDAVERVARIIDPDAFSTNYMSRNEDWQPDDDKPKQMRARDKAHAILATDRVAGEAAIAKLVAETGSRDVEDLKDMALVGHSTMAAIEAVVTSDGPFKGWSPAQDPAEIITDLFGALTDSHDESAIRADEREKCAKAVVARSDAVMAEAEAAHDDDNYDLYERLECEAGNYMDIAAAIRSGGGA